MEQTDVPWKPDNSFEKPDHGKMYAAFLVDFEGLDPNGSSYNPLYFSFTDQDGYEYNTSLFGKDPSLKSANDLEPGQKAKGWLTFEVPTETTSGDLVYKPVLGLGGDSVRYSVTFK